MYLGGPHIIDVLRVIDPALHIACADELAGLQDDVADAPLPHARIFPAGSVHAVHHHARHRLHAVVTLAAGFTLDEPREEFSVGKCHCLTSFRFLCSLCPWRVPRAKAKIRQKRRRAVSAALVRLFPAGGQGTVFA